MSTTLRTLTRAGLAGCIVVLLAAELVVATATPAIAGSWSQDHCDGSSWSLTVWRRADAQAYAQRADREGYEWGGGCYRLNDRDDTPGVPDSGGEGADCSGFTFKSWALKIGYGNSGFTYWEHEREVHGPYSTADFHAPGPSVPFKLLANKSYATTAYMDAFVYRSGDAGHIGMIYLEGSGGSDYIVEAKSDAAGTRIAYTNYRSQSAYKGVTRKAWTADCYPNCQ
jgi:hypothetical protein